MRFVEDGGAMQQEGGEEGLPRGERASASARALVLLGTRGTAAFRRVLRHSPLERGSERTSRCLQNTNRLSAAPLRPPLVLPQSGWAAGDRFVG